VNIDLEALTANDKQCQKSLTIAAAIEVIFGARSFKKENGNLLECYLAKGS
jgi:hypothetical protein